MSGKVVPLQLNDQLAYLTGLSYYDSQSAITVFKVFKDLVLADIWSMYQGTGTGHRNLGIRSQDLRTKTEFQEKTRIKRKT